MAAGDKRTRGKKASQWAELRALWILQEQAAHPSVRPMEMRDRVRNHFRCGERQADESMRRANELYQASVDKPVIAGRITQHAWHALEEAQRDRAWSAVARLLEVLSKHTGAGAPSQVEHSGSIGGGAAIDYDELTDAQLEALAALDRAKAKAAAASASEE